MANLIQAYRHSFRFWLIRHAIGRYQVVMNVSFSGPVSIDWPDGKDVMLIHACNFRDTFQVTPKGPHSPSSTLR